MIFTFSLPVTLTTLTFDLYTSNLLSYLLLSSAVSTKRKVSMAFLFRENGSHGTDGQTGGQTGGQGATLNVTPR